MIIEFLGLSGAGKSYIADSISEKKGISLLKESAGKEKYILALSFIIKRPLFFLAFLWKLIKENKHNKSLLKHKFRNLLIPLLARLAKATKQKDIIIEAGLLQFLISLYERKLKISDLNWASKYFKNKDQFLVYLVEADADTRMRRMRQRGRIPRSSLMTEDQRAQWFEVLEHNYEVIKEFIGNNFTYEIVKNN